MEFHVVSGFLWPELVAGPGMGLGLSSPQHVAAGQDSGGQWFRNRQIFIVSAVKICKH